MHQELLGAHLSIAGGLHEAARRAAELGATALQIFVHNQRRWESPRVTAADARNFRAAVEGARLRVVGAHASYLLNLATGKPLLYRKSIRMLRLELIASRKIGADFLTVHPGAHTDTTPRDGLKRIANACRRAIDGADEAPMLLLETTAGSGSTLGCTFEQLAFLLESIDRPGRVGMCLDTCHIFAAGYDIRTERAYRRTMSALDRSVGVENVRLVHANDSRYELGSRRDRHWHIGHGKIGLKAFELLMNDERFARCAKILETPKEDEWGNPMDPANLRTLLELKR